MSVEWRAGPARTPGAIALSAVASVGFTSSSLAGMSAARPAGSSARPPLAQHLSAATPRRLVRHQPFLRQQPFASLPGQVRYRGRPLFAGGTSVTWLNWRHRQFSQSLALTVGRVHDAPYPRTPEEICVEVADPSQARAAQHHPVQLAVSDLAQPGADVAAYRNAAQAEQLRGPPRRPGPDPGVGRKIGELGAVARAAAAALQGQSVPRIRRIAAADSSALGRNPVAGLSAISSA